MRRGGIKKKSHQLLADIALARSHAHKGDGERSTNFTLLYLFFEY
jgi:hypothetical protein